MPSQSWPTPAQQPSGDVLGSSLGSVLNSQSQGGVTGGGLGDILGSILGGSGLDSVGNNSALAPIIDQIAQRFNIPPAVARMVVAFAIAHLTQAHAQGGIGRTTTGNSQVGQLVNQMCSRGGCSPAYLHQTGLPGDLARHTGLDADQSAQILQYTLNTLGRQLGTG